MRAVFGEIKQFKQCYGAPPTGNFALEAESGKAASWDHCREQFASKFGEKTPGFFFSHPAGKSVDVANFVVKFESIIGIEELKTACQYSRFAKTTKDIILWVEPSSFWVSCVMKRSLYTLILRCGMNYNTDKDNFDDALFGEYKDNIWARETKPAILRFMFGFTRFTGNVQIPTSWSTVQKHGWHEEFKKADEPTIRRRLILPEGENRESSIIGVESLWA